MVGFLFLLDCRVTGDGERWVGRAVGHWVDDGLGYGNIWSDFILLCKGVQRTLYFCLLDIL